MEAVVLQTGSYSCNHLETVVQLHGSCSFMVKYIIGIGIAIVTVVLFGDKTP
jgi:hypothetical protein